MTQQPRQPTTTAVATLGTEALLEDILSQLLEHRGHAVRLLHPYPTEDGAELLEGAGVVLHAPGLDEGARGAFLASIRRSPKMMGVHITDEDARESISGVFELERLQAEDVANAVVSAITQPDRVSVKLTPL